MTQLSKIEIQEIVTVAVKAALTEKEENGCCAERCNEKCGLTPRQHAEDHSYIDSLRKVFGDTGKTVRVTAIVSAISAILTLIVLGLVTYFKKNMV